MHWYLDYISNYRKECKNNEYGIRKCRHSSCEWCKYFLDDIKLDLGYRKELKPYLYSTITEYREACAIFREREEKFRVFENLPNPFLKYYNLNSFDLSFNKLSWGEIRSLESSAELYKDYRKKISINVAMRVANEYEHACQLEKEKAKAPAERVKPTNALSQAYVKSTETASNAKAKLIFRKCKNCDRQIVAPEIYCYECDPYIDLHIESSKLDTNLGVFRTHAPLFAPSLRPIDVPAADYSRFENASSNDKLLEDKYINPPKRPTTQPPVKEKNTTQFHINIKSEYEAKAFAIIANNSKKAICADEDLFYTLAIALRISGHRKTLTEVVDEYALQNYIKT